MNNYITTIGSRTAEFTEEYLRIDDVCIPYEKMSKIRYRSGPSPGFVFEYENKNLIIPCRSEEKNAMYPFFQKAALCEKKRKEKPTVAPVAPTGQTQSSDEITDQPEDTKRSKHLRCSKCGSSNVVVQNTEKTSFKQGHGCLWFILFGWIYIGWIFIKWSYKYTVAMFYWALYGWIRLIIQKAHGSSGPTTPEWYRRMMRRKGKMYSDTVTHALCQDCGHSWIVK